VLAFRTGRRAGQRSQDGADGFGAGVVAPEPELVGVGAAFGFPGGLLPSGASPTASVVGGVVLLDPVGGVVLLDPVGAADESVGDGEVVPDGVGDGLGDGVSVGDGDDETGGDALALGPGVLLDDGQLGVGLGGLGAWPDGDPAVVDVGTDPWDGGATLGPPPLFSGEPLPLVPPPLPREVCSALPVLPNPVGAAVVARPRVSASAPVPTTSTKAAIAAAGRSQRWADGAPCAGGRSQSSTAVHRRRPNGSAPLVSQAAGACRGACTRDRIFSSPSPPGSTDSAAARKAARNRSS
jgi:hypothetical protein